MMKIILKYLIFPVPELGFIGHEQHGPTAGAAGGDDPKSSGFLHAHRDEDDA